MPGPGPQRALRAVLCLGLAGALGLGANPNSPSTHPAPLGPAHTAAAPADGVAAALTGMPPPSTMCERANARLDAHDRARTARNR